MSARIKPFVGPVLVVLLLVGLVACSQEEAAPPGREGAGQTEAGGPAAGPARTEQGEEGAGTADETGRGAPAQASGRKPAGASEDEVRNKLHQRLGALRAQMTELELDEEKQNDLQKRLDAAQNKLWDLHDVSGGEFTELKEELEADVAELEQAFQEIAPDPAEAESAEEASEEAPAEEPAADEAPAEEPSEAEAAEEPPAEEPSAEEHVEAEEQGAEEDAEEAPAAE